MPASLRKSPANSSLIIPTSTRSYTQPLHPSVQPNWISCLIPPCRNPVHLTYNKLLVKETISNRTMQNYDLHFPKQANLHSLWHYYPLDNLKRGLLDQEKASVESSTLLPQTGGGCSFHLNTSAPVTTCASLQQINTLEVLHFYRKQERSWLQVPLKHKCTHDYTCVTPTNKYARSSALLPQTGEELVAGST